MGGPRRTDEVNIAGVGCVYPKNTVRDIGILFGTIVQEYAPTASTWLRRVIAQTISTSKEVNNVLDNRTFGDVSFLYATNKTSPTHRGKAANGQAFENVNLSVYATGFKWSLAL
jgi:hypothetical protein